MLAKPVPKKEVSTTPETLCLVTKVYGYEISVGRCLLNKDYVSASKGVHEQKLCNSQQSL